MNFTRKTNYHPVTWIWESHFPSLLFLQPRRKQTAVMRSSVSTRESGCELSTTLMSEWRHKNSDQKCHHRSFTWDINGKINIYRMVILKKTYQTFCKSLMYCNNPLCVTTQKYIHVHDDFFLFSRGSVSQNALGAKNGFHKFKLWSFFPHSSHISFDNKFLVHKEMDGSAKKNKKKTQLVFNLWHQTLYNVFHFLDYRIYTVFHILFEKISDIFRFLY